MGYLKQQQIERESLHLNDVKDTNVCKTHIDDYALKRFINSNSINGYCDYCNKSKKVVPLESLIGFMMIGINKFYEDAVNYMSYESSEGGYFGETFSPFELIVDKIELEIDNDKLREDIIESIDDISWSEPDIYFGSLKDSMVYHWNYFKDVVKHKSRYLFSQTANFKTREDNQNAYNILKDISKIVIKANLIKKIPKGSVLYRCRQHEVEIVINKSSEMSSPPIEYAIVPNRMSPAGISMFYCAFDSETAKKETIDKSIKLKKYNTIVTFENIEDIFVIDFSKLPVTSIFDYKKLKWYYPLSFLREFVSDLSCSIKHDGKEHIEYVPTQIVTEYFRFPFNEYKKNKIEGIIYPSSKNKNYNSCVLFYNNDECLKKLAFMESTLKTQKN